MKKYETYLKKSPHRQTRERLFRSLEGMEQYYHHSIPPRAVGGTLKKLGLRVTPAGSGFYNILNGGVEHGAARVKKGKVVHWWVK